ncbi:MAG: hypothetical protein WBQ14_09480 [Gaiellaceae bacterium]
MELPFLPLTQQHVELAPLTAEVLDEASRDYAEFWNDLDARPSTEEGERIVCDLIRDEGTQFSTLLAYVNRLTSESTVDLAGEELPLPEGVAKALRHLQDSFVLLTGISSYDDLLNQPLVPWDEIRAELDTPECREWMKTALAAYRVPEPA